METRYLSDERRIILWRRALFLFRKFKEVEGAFHKAGYEHYRIEQYIVGLNNESKPDIIGWKNSSDGLDDIIILELTLNDRKSKHEQLEKYRNLEREQFAPPWNNTSGFLRDNHRYSNNN